MPDVDTKIHYLQAANTFQTNIALYGNTLSLRDGLNKSLLVAFWRVSCSWHTLAEMIETNLSKRRNSVEGKIMHKKPMVSVSPLAVQKALWTLSVLEQSYKKLLGPSAQVRLHRMLALQEIANCVAEMLIVLATGGRKTLLYVLLSFFPGHK